MITALLVCLLVNSTLADEGGALKPGLFAEYRNGKRSVRRIDPAVAFDWGDKSPDQRVAAGLFEATWNARLLVRKTGRYRFHAHAVGDVQVQVAGKDVLAGRRDTAGMIDGKPVELRVGFHPIRIVYRKTAANASVKFFWSSEHFPLEPITAHRFFLDTSDEKRADVEVASVAATGREVFDSLRCNRCHRRANDVVSTPGPDLTHVASGLPEDWLVEKLLNPRHDNPHAQMPSFNFNRRQAQDVAAFLLAKSKPVKLSKVARSKDAKKDRRAGEVLVRSLGCLACHTVGKHGASPAFTGGDLTAIGRKRTAAWLTTWLTSPDRLNADHRMPVFQLTAAERRQMVAYLSSRGKAAAVKLPVPNLPADQIARGEKLVKNANCANCHRIPGLKPDERGLVDLTGALPWDQSCISGKGLTEKQRAGGQPRYTDSANLGAIRAYVATLPRDLAPISRFEHGRLTMRRNNCLACHERDTTKGIVPIAGQMAQIDAALQGQSQALIPPALTAIGDKLHDNALLAALSGDTSFAADAKKKGDKPSRRLPWLKVRMPRFRFTEQQKEAIAEYLIAADRIPDEDAKETTASSQTLVDGQTLLGVRGFSCIACHAVGAYQPKKVALGTRGSDLMLPGRRMRRSYFLRWTRSPIRIVPGMEMPSYHRAVPGVLDEDADKQLAVLWQALNDPRLTPPTNPQAVEQFWTVAPGAPPRVIRDVFTVPKENGGGYVARSLAIGLNNGHNILYDLDAGCVRGWYFGDFARQYTQGKSWYWDMAGVPVMTGLTAAPDIILVKKDAKTGKEQVILPKRVDGRIERLSDFQTPREFMIGTSFLTFEIDGKLQELWILTAYYPVASKRLGLSGWVRKLTVSPFSKRASGWRDIGVFAGIPNSRRPIGKVQIDALDARDIPIAKASGRKIPGIAGRTYFPMTPSDKELSWKIGLRFGASLMRGRSAPVAKLESPVIQPERVDSVPGYHGTRLPVPRSIMPTGLHWLPSGKLAFTCLKGRVFVASDANGDAVEDKLNVICEGLAAPYGLTSFLGGRDLIVSHKSDVVTVTHKPGNDASKSFYFVIGSGWGYSDNYHDWTCGIVRDKDNNLFVGLGSDYSQPKRSKETARWRGKVVKISRLKVTPVGHSFRYPTGLAINDAGDVFVSDNQGVQNTFNEINHLQDGKHYGVPSRWETNRDAPVTPPAIQVPHPWTRSVNGIFFLPRRAAGVSPPRPANRGKSNGENKDLGGLTPTARHFVPQFAGHGIGCEYDNRFLIRFSLQKVDGVYQGACYAFSKPDSGAGGKNFTGPLCGGVAPDGAIYIGSIHDSGWLGGQNTGDIVRLVPNGKLPNGIRELRATKDGFEIDFIHPVDPAAAAEPENYGVSGYTRVWKGGYSTPDSGRHELKIKRVAVSKDARNVKLTVDGRRTGYVYDVSCGKINAGKNKTMWPDTGHYTLHRIPKL